jgi:hypothetical protein
MKQPPLTDLTPEAMRALVAELEAEAARRRAERVAKGEFVRGPLIVVGHQGSVQRAKANAIMALRERGETREIIFDHPTEICMMVTGVPRPGRDDHVPYESTPITWDERL